MAYSSSLNLALTLLIFSFTSSLFLNVSANFYTNVDITWGDGRAKILNNGELLTLSLDKASGSGFQSKNEYLFGKIDMQLKLVPGNSAGTVTAYYLSSQGSTHDEIDFEFLGNSSGDPYTVHTNVFSQGKGNREQQFHLWFDPTADFHTYTILWNPQRIIFSVDGTPIRDFKNPESVGVAYPKNQPMRIYSSLWNAEDWATQGGRVKTDWSKAPFSASYKNFKAEACTWSSGSSSCGSSSSSGTWLSEELDSTSQGRLKWVQDNYMIYNYCNDKNRFPNGMPAECTMSLSSNPQQDFSSKLQRIHLQASQNKAMASSYSSMLFIILVGSLLVLISAGILVQEFDLTWGESKIDSTGELLTLTLDQTSGSGFQSKNEYLFGEIDMQIKLVAGNSAGTVTAYYVSPLVLSLSLFVQLSSQGTTHDEIDFEFLGNLSGDPYILHTNVFSQGKGNREQQFYLWFDPTVDFHTYTIRWNPQRIAFLVDGIPIRVYKNPESIGVPYPKDQPMRIHSSLWNADNWATKGGLVKIDWSEAPFVASYRNFTAKACVWSSGSSSCPESLTSANPAECNMS